MRSRVAASSSSTDAQWKLEPPTSILCHVGFCRPKHLNFECMIRRRPEPPRVDLCHVPFCIVWKLEPPRSTPVTSDSVEHGKLEAPRSISVTSDFDERRASVVGQRMCSSSDDTTVSAVQCIIATLRYHTDCNKAPLIHNQQETGIPRSPVTCFQ